MQLITYRSEPVAIVMHGDLAVLAPYIGALRLNAPVRRFVTAMCRLAMELELGLASGGYEQTRAEAHARALLMPATMFRLVEASADCELAELFCVPLEQVAKRRADLAGRRETW
jgi:hypothetical protein